MFLLPPDHTDIPRNAREVRSFGLKICMFHHFRAQELIYHCAQAHNGFPVSSENFLGVIMYVTANVKG